jgi:hypothetical protein
MAYFKRLSNAFVNSSPSSVESLRRKCWVSPLVPISPITRFAAIVQIIKGEAALTVGNDSGAGKSGTWIQMTAKIPHSIEAESPVVMLLTLLK